MHRAPWESTIQNPIEQVLGGVGDLANALSHDHAATAFQGMKGPAHFTYRIHFPGDHARPVGVKFGLYFGGLLKKHVEDFSVHARACPGRLDHGHGGRFRLHLK